MHCFATFTFEKYCDLETWAIAHSRSFEMTTFDRSHTTSY